MSEWKKINRLAKKEHDQREADRRIQNKKERQKDVNKIKRKII